MKIKKHILTILMIVSIAITATAGAGKEAILMAKSESGKAQLNIKIWDVYDAVSQAQVVTTEGTFDLSGYDAFKVIDLPNHIFTICFSEKGKPADAPDTKVLKVWGIPSSFVKTPGGESNWRFKLKVNGNILKETTALNGTFEWNP